MTEKERDEIMKVKSISIPESLWEEAKRQAQENAQSLSAVLRLLIEKWLSGEVDLSRKDKEK